MKHLFLFILLLAATNLFSQSLFEHERISVMVSDAHNNPIDAIVEIIGQPQIKFKAGNREYSYNTYYIEKADYPAKHDTLYYLKISAAGYPSIKTPLRWASNQLYMFKPGETYVYEGAAKTPVQYNNRYLAGIIPNKAKVDSFCKAYNLSIAYSYDYCGGSWKGHKEGAPNTFIVQKNDSSTFGNEGKILKAFRDSFPNQAGSFYTRGQGYPYGALIYYANEVEVSFANAATFAKVDAYIKTIAGATYKNQVYGSYAQWQLMQVTLPNSWNIDKLNAFIDKVIDMGAIGAQASGVTALECPN